MLVDQVKRLMGQAHPAYLVAAAVVIWTSFVMADRYCVLPWLDQWTFLREYQDLQDHGFSLGWLFASHNGHRIATSRPLFLADLEWFGGRNTLLVVCIWLVQLSAALLFVRLSRNVDNDGLRALAIGVAVSFLFNLMQWQNFLQGYQIQFVGVFALGAWSAYSFFTGVFETKFRFTRLILPLVLLLLGSFTMANGFLAGAAIAAVCLLSRQRPWAAVTVAAATLLIGVCYTLGTDTPRPPVSQILLGDWWLYVTLYIGNIWSGMSLENTVVGGFGAFGGLLFLGAILRTAKQPDAARATLTAIMLFVVLSGMLTALGRLHFGVAEALDSRFGTPSAYFWAAAAVFWARELSKESGRFIHQSAIAVFSVTIGLAVFPLQYVGDRQSVLFANAVGRAERLLAANEDRRALAILSNGDRSFYQQVGTSDKRSLSILRERRLSIFR